MRLIAVILFLLCTIPGVFIAQTPPDQTDSTAAIDSLQALVKLDRDKDHATLKHLIGLWKNMPLEITLADSTILTGKAELTDNGVLITVKKSTGLTLTNDEKVKLEWSRIEKVRLAKIDNSTAIYWLIIGAIVTGYLGMSLR